MAINCTGVNAAKVAVLKLEMAEVANTGKAAAICAVDIAAKSATLMPEVMLVESPLKAPGVSAATPLVDMAAMNVEPKLNSSALVNPAALVPKANICAVVKLLAIALVKLDTANVLSAAMSALESPPNTLVDKPAMPEPRPEICVVVMRLSSAWISCEASHVVNPDKPSELKVATSAVVNALKAAVVNEPTAPDDK